MNEQLTYAIRQRYGTSSTESRLISPAFLPSNGATGSRVTCNGEQQRQIVEVLLILGADVSSDMQMLRESFMNKDGVTLPDQHEVGA